MAEVFLGQILLVPYNFAPQGFEFCNGQLLPIAQYAALFSLIGTYYGGNGVTNFALPNLQDSVAMGSSNEYYLGEVGGSANVTLTVNELPGHSHLVRVSEGAATTSNPAGAFAVPNVNARMNHLYAASSNSDGVSTGGNPSGNGPHSNVQPYLVMSYIIAMVGVYPARS